MRIKKNDVSLPPVILILEKKNIISKQSLDTQKDTWIKILGKTKAMLYWTRKKKLQVLSVVAWKNKEDYRFPPSSNSKVSMAITKVLK